MLIRSQDQVATTTTSPLPLPHDPALVPTTVNPRAVSSKAKMANSGGLYHDSKPLPSVPSSTSLGPRSSHSSSTAIPRRISTIRTVPSFDDRPRSFDDEASSDGSPSLAGHSNSAFSTSVNSNGSTFSDGSQPRQASSKASSARIKHGPPVVSVLDTYMQPPDVSARPAPGASLDIPQRESSLGVAGRQPASADHFALGQAQHRPGQRPTEETHGSNATLGPGDGQMLNGWDATVGKAGLGKTGRVINRLVSDNEALKRDLKIERLRAEESRQAARLLEDKMERLISDYESRLLEANVTKTLLSRKERQVESLQAAVELERKRTTDAQDRERTWRAEMEKVRSETKRRVDEASNHAALMEGRYNAISSHWREQGDEVRRAMARMASQIQDLLEERRSDDDKITVLRELCDQQDSNIKDLSKQKEDIAQKFQHYKDEQENALRDIKQTAAEREADQERTLEEAREVLDKLKWALSIKGNIEVCNPGRHSSFLSLLGAQPREIQEARTGDANLVCNSGPNDVMHLLGPATPSARQTSQTPFTANCHLQCCFWADLISWCFSERPLSTVGGHVPASRRQRPLLARQPRDGSRGTVPLSVLGIWYLA